MADDPLDKKTSVAVALTEHGALRGVRPMNKGTP